MPVSGKVRANGVDRGSGEHKVSARIEEPSGWEPLTKSRGRPIAPSLRTELWEPAVEQGGRRATEEETMCGRFTLTSTPEQLAEELELTLLPSDYRPRYNIAPLQPVLVVRQEEDGDREAAMLRWGLVPFWAKEPSMGNRMINARAETVAEKPAYKNAFARRRCLVLADGFYESQRLGSRKVPMWIHRQDA